jgi:acyl-CoA synthetase (NDP forming)
VAQQTDLPLDASGRPTALRTVPLERFFSPRTMAVIGASDTEGRPNTAIFRRLKEWAATKGATVYPVNPNRETVDGDPCFPSVVDVPGDVDLAVILTGDVTGSVDSAIEKGVTFAVAFGSGFAEVGEEGKKAQDALTETILASDLHLLGPNTNLNAFEQFRDDLEGPAIALISQSGHQGRPIFQAQEIGIRVSRWAPTGNEVDLEFADFAAWFSDQPEIATVAAYIEGFKDGRTMVLAADHLAHQGVPLVIVKVGRTDEGSSMASSHTGKLTGSDAVTDAVFRQYGVTRVDGLDEMLDTSAMLSRARAPQGDGVVVYAISGGTGAHMADLCSAAGLRLPTLSDDLQTRLYEWIPEYLRVSNPVDNGGHPVGDERGRKILDALVADPDVSVLICPITGAFPPMSDRLAQDLVDVAETTDKPICVVWGSPVGTEMAYRDILLQSDRVITFRSFPNCVAAVKAYLDHHAFVDGYTSPFADRSLLEPSPAAAEARALVEGKDALSEHDAKQVLRAYGIPVTEDVLVTSPEDAVAAAATLGGGPVVLKACGPTLLHKSEHDLVKVGVAADDVRAVTADLLDRATNVAVGGEVEGVLVCPMAVLDDSVEMVVGLASDPLFGPVVLAGLGGVFVEVLKDVTFRVPPFGADEARKMLDELRGRAMLDGVRGAEAVDVDALVDIIVKVGRLGLDLADVVAEVDVNPLVVTPSGAVALDALVVPKT